MRGNEWLDALVALDDAACSSRITSAEDIRCLARCRYWYEGHVDWHSWIGGALQTALYGDFFYYYYLSWKMNTNFKLPS